MGQTYVTEVNGNPGDGIIDITGKNYFIELIEFVKIKARKSQTKVIDTSSQDGNEEEHSDSESSSMTLYNELLSKEKQGKLNYNEGGLLSFYKDKFRRLR